MNAGASSSNRDKRSRTFMIESGKRPSETNKKTSQNSEHYTICWKGEPAKKKKINSNYLLSVFFTVPQVGVRLSSEKQENWEWKKRDTTQSDTQKHTTALRRRDGKKLFKNFSASEGTTTLSTTPTTTVWCICRKARYGHRLVRSVLIRLQRLQKVCIRGWVRWNIHHKIAETSNNGGTWTLL